MTIADIIGTQADESTAALLAHGWEGGGHSYDIGAYHGDEEALAEKLGRRLTRDECASLEHQIRRRLDAAIREPA
jgi:hypothetical protein